MAETLNTPELDHLLAANGLVLETVTDERSARDFAVFNAAFNGLREGLTSDCLVHHFPDICRDQFFMLRDATTSEVVMSICLVPWSLSFESVHLKAVMVEMVLTHPQYRRKGLVRAMIHLLHDQIARQDFDIVLIWGIPFYYRQFGYTYCLDATSLTPIDIHALPAGNPDQSSRYHLKQASLDDIPDLMRCHDKMVRGYGLHSVRGPELWQFYLSHAGYPIQIVIEQDTSRVAGYCMAIRNGSDEVRIIEDALDTDIVAENLMAHYQQIGVSRLVFDWPWHSRLARACMKAASAPSAAHSKLEPGGNQWLIRIPDLARLMNRLAPVWQNRLLQSPHRDLTMDLKINLYQEAYTLQFRDGQLLSVDNIGFVDTSMGSSGGDLCIPRDAFVRLLLGYRAIDELTDAWPDIWRTPAKRDLIKVLFPRFPSYVNLPFSYLGPDYDLTSSV